MSLDSLLRPQSVAVLGASGRQENLFARPLRFLARNGYPGEIYPVNPSRSEIEGLKCFPSLGDVPGDVDLVLMLVASAEAVDQISVAAEVGAEALVVFASGFAETGEQGALLEEKLREEVARHGIRVLGPNTQGIADFRSGMWATFTPALDGGPPAPGPIAYVGQSGAIGGVVLDLGREAGLGFSCWASTGNEADLTACELGLFLLDDPDVETLALYVEGIVDGAELDRLTETAVAANKKIVMLRTGRTAAGRRAAVSHTGALIGDEAGFVAMCRERGVRVVEDVPDLITSLALSPRTARSGRGRLGIVTSSGGAGAVAADLATDHGLAVESFSDATTARLATLVPDFGSVANPVDVTAQTFVAGAGDFGDVCGVVADDPGVDLLVVVLTMLTGELAEQAARQIARRLDDDRLPVVVAWLASRDSAAPGVAVLREAGIPVVGSVDIAVRNLARTVTESHVQPEAVESTDDTTRVDELVGRLTVAGEELTEWEAGDLLDAAGVRRPGSRLTGAGDDVALSVKGLRPPFALKIQARGLVHKSDRGGVRLGVAPGEAPKVHEELMRAFEGVDGVLGVLVQEMAEPGVELLVGVTGPRHGYPALLTVGMGGVLTEIYRDVATASVPVTATRCEHLLDGLRAAPLLRGFRGGGGHDVGAAAEALERLSALAHRLGDSLVELEINPLIVHREGHGVSAVDVVARLRRPDE